MSDNNYAYKKVKLSEKQQHFCDTLERHHNGKSDHIGVDYGGWTAHNQIVAALKKKGVLVSEKDNRYTLVVGEPQPIVEPKLEKPYIKIRKEILTATTDGDTFDSINAQIYLDTRKDCTFHIIFPFNIKPFLKSKLIGQATIMSINEEAYLVAQGTSVEECINNFQNLTTEYKLNKDGKLKDVIIVSYDSNVADPVAGMLHCKTEFGFNYFRAIQSSEGDVYFVDKDGYLRMWEKYYQLQEDRNLVIDWSEQREAALAELRQRIIEAADRMRELMFGQEFTNMLDSGGQLLLEGK